MLEDRLSPIFKHGFFWSEKKVIPNNFPTLLITPKEDGRLITSGYRKPTHTDLYLQWHSHHTIPSQYSMVGTLYHRAKTICSSPQLLQEEEQHQCQTIKRGKYPTWAINRVKLRNKAPAKHKYQTNNYESGQNKSNNKKPYIIVPYYQGLSESIKGTCRKYGVQVHFKGGLTIKNLLMAPNDKDPILKKSGFKEHLKAPSPIYDHYNTSGCNVIIENFSIMGRETKTS